ncbi:hypothetical protein BDM02DRAFT_3192892 [Thelephora ganbajun]|uniref:Uncharacterized protein n=1 Tax=Thelephora ganbajun TaxID=370292 RepID=A0ACB6YZF8_THEGA|nr:hypothetical protein BDM02DRAFT_3192892 [Thelephora ganbajun]
MTLENNHTFISPHNQKISRIDTRSHSKDGQMTNDAYGFTYPTMSLLVDAVISQVDNEFPRRQYATGCSFNDVVWQQAIGALKNLDHVHQSKDHGDDEHVLFSLVQVGLLDHQAFDLPHKWSSRSIRYSAVVADCLWTMHVTERARNNRVEAELNALKGEVQLLSMRLLAVDRFSFDANTKVNEELMKDGARLDRHCACLNMIASKHNMSIEYLSNLSSQQELHRVSLLALHENICLCNVRSSSAEAPVVSSPSLSPEPPCDLQALEDPEVSSSISSVPMENTSPIPILEPVITAEEEQEIEDRLVSTWQAQGRARENASILDGSESNETSAPRCATPVVELTRGQLVTLSPEVRGYRLLSVMRAVTLMPNGTVFSHLRSSDFVGGELQLVFPLNQEDFDALVSGELSAEVRPVTVLDVV